MDKEWMSKNRLSCEYEDGVELFLQFALQNCLDSNQIPCPCAKCGNLKKKNVITIRAHLCCHSMDLTYHTWIFHGEKSKLATIVDERNEMFEGDQHQEEEDPADMVDDVYETFQDNPTQFKKLLEDAEKALYPKQAFLLTAVSFVGCSDKYLALVKKLCKATHLWLLGRLYSQDIVRVFCNL